MKSLQQKLLAVLLTISILCMTGAVLFVNAATSTYTVSVTGTAYYDRGREMLSMLNQLRAEQGKSALTLDNELTELAMVRAVEASVDFSHTRPDGSSCFTISAKVSGENLAGGCSTAEKTFNQWKKSSGHYANMIAGDYKSVGIACFETNGSYYWVQLFSYQSGSGSCKSTSQTYSHSVTVAPKSGDIIGFNLEESNLSLNLNENTSLRVYRTNPGWTDADTAFDASSFTWTSSDTSVATVDQNGIVYAKKEGQVTITATAKTGTLTYSKTLTAENKALANVTGSNSIVRIYGETRYGTSVNIAEQLKTARSVTKFDTVILAYSQNYPDALSGSYLAAIKHAPILVVNSVNGGDTSQSLMKDYIRYSLKQGGTLYVLGGNSVVSQSYAKSVAEQVGAKTVFLAGDTRYDTNLAILKEAGLTNQSEILIASASTSGAFADALSASSTGKPLLLVDQSGLTQTQLNYLKSSGLKKATILGGVNAVSSNAETQLKNLGFSVERLAGKTRYETSTKVAAKYFSSPTAVTLAWGGNFPDALCGGPLAYTLHAPVVLTDASSTAAKTYATSLRNFKVVAFGGAGSNNNQLTNNAIRAVKDGTITEYKVDY